MESYRRIGWSLGNQSLLESKNSWFRQKIRRVASKGSSSQCSYILDWNYNLRITQLRLLWVYSRLEYP
nr:MAG TPA: hypothetical protein [Caudoviricetes sp.]